LKDIKPTIVVAFSIPISVLFAVVLMYFTGITLNIISLSGLALGIGMLVDNSIVVIENIYRLRSQGMSAARAAVMGANQVAGAIFASTLTTVCVFLPIVFTTGLTRQLFTDMALTIAYSLIASLIVALTVVPAMGATVLKNSKEKSHKLFDRVMVLYEKTLRLCLKWKIVPLTLTIALLVFSIWQVTRMGLILIPEMGGNQMSVSVTAPEEASTEEAYALADALMEQMGEISGVDTVGAMSGGSTMSILGGSSSSSGPISFSFYVILDDEAAKDNTAVANEIQAILDQTELEGSVSTSNMDLSSITSSGLEIQIYGTDSDEMLAVSEDMMELLSQIDGFTDITNGQEEGDPQIKIIVNKDQAMSYGLTVAQVYAELASRLSTETTATTLTIQSEEYAVVIVDETDTVSLDNLMDQEFTVTTTDEEGESVEEVHKLGEFASEEEGKSLASISRENQSRYITVSATTEDGYNTTLLSRQVEPLIEAYEAPEGISIQIDGESTTVMEAMSDMLLMIGMAIIFIYLIMVAQFQSLLSPFIVLFTIPLAFTGGLLGLLLAGEQISLIAMMGFLVLAGVVVNNGIVFVDYANQLRLEGMEKREALVETGKARMRPILMTALTTILAMTTMAFSQNAAASMGKGMAIVTIGGLAYATIMTLYIVPVLYDLLFRRELKKVDLGDETTLIS
jgi:HAE1 family hydrophobic/amphiphilic exporter-1